MLRHLQQTLAAHPDLADGLAPAGLLHPSEQAKLDSLRVLKRRRDWLLGRWTAKHLIQQYLEETTAARHPLPAIVIATDPDGAPFAALGVSSGEGLSAPGQESFESGPPVQRLALSLSISHSGDRAFCALIDEPGVSVGADLELIEPRERALPEQFFTVEELAFLDTVAQDQYDEAVTAIWCAKEAVLKALRTGLRTDTRWLTCVPDQNDIRQADWASFVVSFDSRLESADSRSVRRTIWHLDDPFVFALAVVDEPPGAKPATPA